ncbi:PREDICTED: uncharacterized protein LOC105359122 [Ceratosolen solmsi marchali]|uniref:Uncharacterized protein LOC105359122 n=1 Tax=Ceratosolen solmsi marchali TaxID=326594 RepID=A0AAJ6VK89_9HYME|nr:PREDICTED: uncharacterized protein LOC105359122 [Ceratosolen solmsi marchali]
MLAAQICREFHLGVIASRMQSRVPRCLFGPPNSKETMELLQEALETERSRFAKRWGVDPLAEDEDKENGSRNGGGVLRLTPTKKRVSPYAKQTSIHDYWRSRKICDTGKKSNSVAFIDVSKNQHQQHLLLLQQQLQQQQQQQLQQQQQSQPHQQNFIDKLQSSTK